MMINIYAVDPNEFDINSEMEEELSNGKDPEED